MPAANLLILKASQGLPGLGASSAMPPRIGNRTDFTRFAGELTRVQNLVTFGTVGTALKLSLGGQYTGDILPSGEKFFCCGLRWSRGYFYGQVTGDRGVGTAAELQLNTGFTGMPILAADHRLDVQFYGFYNFGQFYNLAPGEFNQTADSVGIGAQQSHELAFRRPGWRASPGHAAERSQCERAVRLRAILPGGDSILTAGSDRTGGKGGR